MFRLTIESLGLYVRGAYADDVAYVTFTQIFFFPVSRLTSAVLNIDAIDFHFLFSSFVQLLRVSEKDAAFCFSFFEVRQSASFVSFMLLW